jgi:phage minor structural protein
MSNKFRPSLELHTSSLRHILADAAEIRVREALNGEFYVSFVYPRMDDDNARYAALAEDNEIRFPVDAALRNVSGQRFVINRVEEVREGKRIYKRVEASHIAFGLGRYYYDDYTDFSAAEPLADMLALLGSGTPYEFAISGTFADTDIFEYGEDTRFNLAQKLRQTYSAELAFNNDIITFTTQKGGNRGARVIYRHNMRGITRTSHSMERITRLYGYGKNGLTIEGYAGHATKYIDSTYYDVNNPYEASVTFAEIESQGKLLSEMQRYLAKHELPSVSYDVDFVDIAKVDSAFSPYSIREAGDIVTVTDDELGYAFEARVMEYEWYPYEPRRGRVTLANFRPLKSTDYVYQAVTGVKKAIKYTSTNAVLKGIKYDDSITLVDGLGMRVSDASNRELVRLGQYEPGKYGLALFNTSGVKTLWQDAATGSAWFSGNITASSINGGTITGGAISGGTISGATITGGSINVSTDLYVGRNIFMEASDFLNAKRIYLGPSGLGINIEGDVITQSMYLRAPSKIYLNGTDVIQQINNLWANISALWIEVSGP